MTDRDREPVPLAAALKEATTRLETLLRHSIDWAQEQQPKDQPMQPQQTNTTQPPPPPPPPPPPRTTALARSPVMALSLTTFDEAWRFAEVCAESSFVPAQYRGKPGDCFIAIQMGAELGLGPLAALQNIAVINGRASVWGDALLAIVLAHPHCEDVIESFTKNSETDAFATCTVKRRNRTPVVRTFSVDEAKRAGLWAKAGPWAQYPRRMLQMRARAWALRDQFADALRGISCAEEVLDFKENEAIKMRDPYVQAEVVAPAPALMVEHVKQEQPAALAAVAVVQPTPTAADPIGAIPAEGVIILGGKNKGKRMGDIESPEALNWYADECKDPRLSEAAKAVRNKRVALERHKTYNQKERPSLKVVNGVTYNEQTGEVQP